MRSLLRVTTRVLFLASMLVIFSGSFVRSEVPEDHLKWAMSFTIRDDFQLYSYDGYGLAIARNFSEKTTIRISELLQVSGAGTDDYDFRTATSVVLIRYIRPKQRSRFYWGIGPRYSYHHRYDKDVQYSYKYWTAGAVGIFGIEVRVLDFLRFHTEYCSRFDYSRRYSSNSYDGEESRFAFGLGENVLLGLTLYF